MPIDITPNQGETEDEFVSRCAKYVAEKDPQRPDEERLGICYTIWEKHNENSE